MFSISGLSAPQDGPYGIGCGTGARVGSECPYTASVNAGLECPSWSATVFRSVPAATG